jgi:hypothetical protein
VRIRGEYARRVSLVKAGGCAVEFQSGDEAGWSCKPVAQLDEMICRQAMYREDVS